MRQGGQCTDVRNEKLRICDDFKEKGARLSSIACDTSSMEVKSTKRVSTPRPPRVSRMRETELPNRCLDATMLSPAPLTVTRAWAMAAIPVLRAVTLSAPVMPLTRCSRYVVVGLAMREYDGAGDRPLKASVMALAEGNSNDAVRYTGIERAP